jgi:tRNA-specific 2-thiouridylase
MNGLNPKLKKHFEKPCNTGILDSFNCQGKDSSLKSGTVVMYYCMVRDSKIADISFRTFGCSYSIAASSYITTLAKEKDLFEAATISGDDVEKELGIFPPDKKDSLNVVLGAFHSMLSSYLSGITANDHIAAKNNKIAVAMSGGLDSSMAAKLLQDDGFDIIGITMKIITDKELPAEKKVTSWMSSDIYSAQKVCSLLNIPHFTIDLSNDFNDKIIASFCSEYMQGRTPNPCVECNKYIKFGALLDAGKNLGAGSIATGHYCLVEASDDGSYTVRKGKDRSKEQSYVFWKLDQSQLSRISTPLGNYTKEEIRELSRDFLPLLEQKDESQDICFIAGESYHGFLKDRIKEAGRGDILNTQGEKIGEHRGFPYYTIGQRKGLGISHSRPLYVKEIIPEDNIIIAGEKKDLLQETAVVKDINFIEGSPPANEFNAQIKIRYNSPAVVAKIITGKKGTAKIFFEKKISSVTPGQSAVFYNGDILLGGGIIMS